LVKFIALLVKREGLGEVEFHRHWRYQHGPLAAKISSMRRYCQCHLVPRPPHDLRIAEPFAGTAEVWWEDLAAAEALADDPEYTEHALPDEPKFIDMRQMAFMTVTERVLLDGPPRGREASGIKVIHLLTRAPGMEPVEFRERSAAERDDGESELLMMTRHVRGDCVAAAYEGAEPPAFDGTREMWWPDEWAFAAARENQPDAWAALTDLPYVDCARSAFLVTMENRVVWPT
jgi:uncharacterized protein (TIGR02118 family)